jgi:hypothetical protein
MNLKALTRNRPVRLLKSTFDEWMEDKALRLSAALAYYSIFSIAPLLVIAISVAGLVLGAEAVRGHLDEQLKGYVGAKAAESVQSMVQSSSKRSSGWIGDDLRFRDADARRFGRLRAVEGCAEYYLGGEGEKRDGHLGLFAGAIVELRHGAGHRLSPAHFPLAHHGPGGSQRAL